MSTKTESPADVLAMIIDSGKLSAIADTTGWAKGEIVRLAREQGYVLDASSDRFQPAPRPKPESAASSTTVVPAPSSMTVSIRPAHRDLIEEGKAHSAPRVQRAAGKVEAALAALAQLLDETREAEAAKRAAEAERAAVRAELARLDERRAELTAKLRDKPATATETTADAKAVREWARANGVDCPATGRVPRAVLDAYTAALSEKSP